MPIKKNKDYFFSEKVHDVEEVFGVCWGYKLVHGEKIKGK